MKCVNVIIKYSSILKLSNGQHVQNIGAEPHRTVPNGVGYTVKDNGIEL